MDNVADRTGSRRLSAHDKLLVSRLSPLKTSNALGSCCTALSFTGHGCQLVVGDEASRLALWRPDYSGGSVSRSFDTGHTGSILCARFLEGSSGSKLICCSTDRQVRLVDLQKQAVRPYACHRARVKALASVSPAVFLSASEDGAVRLFDIRQPSCWPPCGAHKAGADSSCLLVEQRCERAGRSSLRIGINSLALSPLAPHLFATGGGDPFARLYDMRMLRRGGGSGGPDAQTACGGGSAPASCSRPAWVSAFAPHHLCSPGVLASTGSGGFSTLGRARHLTGLAFAAGGRHMLLSYSGEAIYAVDVAQHAMSCEQLAARLTQHGAAQHREPSPGPGRATPAWEAFTPPRRVGTPSAPGPAASASPASGGRAAPPAAVAPSSGGRAASPPVRASTVPVAGDTLPPLLDLGGGGPGSGNEDGSDNERNTGGGVSRPRRRQRRAPTPMPAPVPGCRGQAGSGGGGGGATATAGRERTLLSMHLPAGVMTISTGAVDAPLPDARPHASDAASGAAVAGDPAQGQGQGQAAPQGVTAEAGGTPNSRPVRRAAYFRYTLSPSASGRGGAGSGASANGALQPHPASPPGAATPAMPDHHARTPRPGVAAVGRATEAAASSPPSPGSTATGATRSRRGQQVGERQQTGALDSSTRAELMNGLHRVSQLRAELEAHSRLLTQLQPQAFRPDSEHSERGEQNRERLRPAGQEGATEAGALGRMAADDADGGEASDGGSGGSPPRQRRRHTVLAPASPSGPGARESSSAAPYTGLASTEAAREAGTLASAPLSPIDEDKAEGQAAVATECRGGSGIGAVGPQARPAQPGKRPRSHPEPHRSPGSAAEGGSTASQLDGGSVADARPPSPASPSGDVDRMLRASAASVLHPAAPAAAGTEAAPGGSVAVPPMRSTSQSPGPSPSLGLRSDRASTPVRLMQVRTRIAAPTAGAAAAGATVAASAAPGGSPSRPLHGSRSAGSLGEPGPQQHQQTGQGDVWLSGLHADTQRAVGQVGPMELSALPPPWGTRSRHSGSAAAPASATAARAELDARSAALLARSSSGGGAAGARPDAVAGVTAGGGNGSAGRVGCVVAAEGGRIGGREEGDGGYMRCFDGHKNIMTSKEVAWMGGSSCGPSYVVSGSDDNHVFVWDYGTGDVVRVLGTGQDHIIPTCLAVHPLEPMIAACGTGTVVKVWGPGGSVGAFGRSRGADLHNDDRNEARADSSDDDVDNVRDMDDALPELPNPLGAPELRRAAVRRLVAGNRADLRRRQAEAASRGRPSVGAGWATFAAAIRERSNDVAAAALGAARAELAAAGEASPAGGRQADPRVNSPPQPQPQQQQQQPRQQQQQQPSQQRSPQQGWDDNDSPPRGRQRLRFETALDRQRRRSGSPEETVPAFGANSPFGARRPAPEGDGDGAGGAAGGGGSGEGGPLSPSACSMM